MTSKSTLLVAAAPCRLPSWRRYPQASAFSPVADATLASSSTSRVRIAANYQQSVHSQRLLDAYKINAVTLPAAAGAT
jgi:hypothetical protein